MNRSAELVELDEYRLGDPMWFQQHHHVGYVAYVDRFSGDLPHLDQHLDYLAELGVTYLHLMSVLRPRDGANDGGFAIESYLDIDPRLGVNDDLVDTATKLRRRGISLCLDLVLNHTAREHAWARAARDGSAYHRDLYLVFADRSEPDAYERTLPEVFPTLAPGNFSFDPDIDGWVWTTFNAYQWDLNYANPNVFLEIAKIMVELANMGVDVMRLDAIAFVWKRLGTNCQNQPEAHLIARALRAFMAIVAPAVLLKAEAIVAPGDLVQYLGGRPGGDVAECHLAYHNQLMVMIWSALASKDGRLATQALESLPPTPTSASFCTYLRCHDDIGWAVDDADASAVGVDGASHRRFLAAWYRGDHPGSTAMGAAFSANPANGDERTSGTAAALAGISAARLSGTVDDLDRAVRRLLVGYEIVYGFGGIPLLYMGDELALDNDLDHLTDPTRSTDSRWMHRPHFSLAAQARRHTAGTVEHRVFSRMKELGRLRKHHPQLSAGGTTWLHRYDDTALIAWARSHPVGGNLFGVANVAERSATLPRSSLRWAGLTDRPAELLGTRLTTDGDVLHLPPLSVCWFVDGRLADSSVVES
jgi:amylosucrase